MKYKIRITCIIPLLLLLIIPGHALASTKKNAERNPLNSTASGLQMPFIENEGQIKDTSVRFYASVLSGSVFVTDSGEIVYSLLRPSASRQQRKPGDSRADGDGERNDNGISDERMFDTAVIRESLRCPEKGMIEGSDRAVTRINYFVGGQDEWRTGVASWREVSLGEIYKGIDLKLRAYGDNVEKIFTVHPHGSADDIRLNIEGVTEMAINASGELEMKTSLGMVKMTRPVAYQDIDGKRVTVPAAYKIEHADRKSESIASALPRAYLTYGFQVAEYDRERPLIIDPLLASTFFGDAGRDFAKAIALDADGNVYVTGFTNSSGFPNTAGVYDNSYQKLYDAYILKFDSGLTNILTVTFLGGNSSDFANAIALDNSGNYIYISGDTYSSDFPVTPGAYRNVEASTLVNYNVFIAKLSRDMTTLAASTLFGGKNDEHSYSLAVSTQGNVYAAGLTRSTAFPVVAGNYDTSFNGVYYDAFISKFNGDLSSLLSSTFLGGTSSDYVNALTLDPSENVYIAGVTNSSNFPVTSGSVSDTTHYNAFAAKMNSTLTQLLASVPVGGSDTDEAKAIARDAGGNIYIAGTTNSSNFPVTAGAYSTSLHGNYDAFITKFNSDLSGGISSSTLIGGSDYETINAIAVDPSAQEIFVAGVTHSPEFPTTPDSFDVTYNGGSFNAFVSRLNTSLAGLLSSTFIGEAEGVSDVRIDAAGDIYVSGYSRMPGFPVLGNAYNTFLMGTVDAFVTKLDHNLFADNDNDGYAPNIDCNDNNPDIYPGAVDIPNNGIDEDCDGKDLVLSDTDGDGISDDADNCPSVANPDQSDTDSDGTGDLCDNCRLVANPGQQDSNYPEDDNTVLDGEQHYGNMCDPDFDNDALVTLQDYAVWRLYYRMSTSTAPEYVDLDSDGIIGLQDYAIWRKYYRGAPGPGIGD